MAISEKPSLTHWNYFLALEADLVTLSRFVELTKDNFATYSIEMAHLLMTAASEVDVVMKKYCAILSPTDHPETIDAYRRIFRPKRPDLENTAVSIARFDVVLSPWKNWQRDETPEWWTDHNKVKHERDEHFSKANLKNTLNAMGALFLLLALYYFEDVECRALAPAPVLFTPPSFLFGRTMAFAGESRISYRRR